MKKPYIALVTLLFFTVYTACALLLAEQSLWAFGVRLMSSPDTAQVVIDLYLLACMACIWMYRTHAQEANRSYRCYLTS